SASGAFDQLNLTPVSVAVAIATHPPHSFSNSLPARAVHKCKLRTWVGSFVLGIDGTTPRVITKAFNRRFSWKCSYSAAVVAARVDSFCPYRFRLLLIEGRPVHVELERLLQLRHQ